VRVRNQAARKPNTRSDGSHRSLPSAAPFQLRHFADTAEEYDKRRTDVLQRSGIRVLRFSNDLVFNETRAVLAAIARALGVPSP